MKFSRFAAVVVVGASVAPSGCAGHDAPATSASAPAASPDEPASSTPTPTPTPTPTETTTPTPNGSTLTTTGLGDLVIGEPVPAATKLLEWGDFCGYGTEQWHAPGATLDDLGPISVKTIDWSQEAPVDGIWIWTDTIETAEGIHLGSTRSELEAAYPDVEPVAGTGTTDLYVEPGDGSNLVFEVVRPGIEVDGTVPDTVRWMYVRDASAEIKTIDGSATPASCG